MFRFTHTNLVARNAQTLIAFYKSVLHCQSIGEPRDLSGAWLEQLTGVNGVHITGEHLLLPGCGPDHPTLEIFEYNIPIGCNPCEINRPGFSHIAFAVDDVKQTLEAVLQAGGTTVGDLITTPYPDGRVLTVVYARDPEGNIIELQSWDKSM